MSLRVVAKVHIERPPADVFAFIADPENLPRWDPSIREVRRKEAGPVGPGSGLLVVAEESGRHLEVDSHVTEFEPDRIFGVAATFSGVPFRLRWRLARDGEGTLLTSEGEAELDGFLALAGGFVKPLIADRLSRAHATLKRLLEDESTGPRT